MALNNTTPHLRIKRKLRCIVQGQVGILSGYDPEDGSFDIEATDWDRRNVFSREVTFSDLNISSYTNNGTGILNEKVGSESYYSTGADDFPTGDYAEIPNALGVGFWSANPVKFEQINEEQWEECMLPFGGVLKVEPDINYELFGSDYSSIRFLWIKPVYPKDHILSEEIDTHWVGRLDTGMSFNYALPFGNFPANGSDYPEFTLCSGRDKMERKMKHGVGSTDVNLLKKECSALVLPLIKPHSNGEYNNSYHKVTHLRCENTSYYEYIVIKEDID